jgi:hypothetical protein
LKESTILPALRDIKLNKLSCHIAIALVTAIPYAAAITEEFLKANTERISANSSAKLMAGT